MKTPVLLEESVAEHKLQVSYQMLHNYWNSYQKHFAAIIQANCHKPHALFQTIDRVLHAAQTVGVESGKRPTLLY